MGSAREWFFFGAGAGTAYGIVSIVVPWLLREAIGWWNSFAMVFKYKSLGVPLSVIAEHESRLEKRQPWYACRRHCVICDDLGLPCREDMVAPLPPPYAPSTTPAPPPSEGG